MHDLYAEARKEKGAPGGAPFVSPRGRSGLAAGEAHGGCAGAVVGLDVDECDHALVDEDGPCCSLPGPDPYRRLAATSAAPQRSPWVSPNRSL